MSYYFLSFPGIHFLKFFALADLSGACFPQKPHGVLSFSLHVAVSFNITHLETGFISLSAILFLLFIFSISLPDILHIFLTYLFRVYISSLEYKPLEVRKLVHFIHCCISKLIIVPGVLWIFNESLMNKCINKHMNKFLEIHVSESAVQFV